MQNGGHGCFSSQVLWITSKLPDSTPGCPEQSVIHLFGILQGQGIKVMGQGKDNMIVGNGKQFIFPIQYPSLPVGRLAFGAVTVAATVVAYLAKTTTGTPGFMATQHGSATSPDGIQGFQYLHTRIVLFNKTIMMDINNLRYLMIRSQQAFS